ncbi:MAG: hypothetical protein IKZ53_00695 [Selenomonadaceae bacterium]|nr:hypothetical protein [Selenomonadaceae bacterium]
MAIKFPLKMRGVDVRNLEDLKKNFELDAAIEYFKDGRLIRWLESRYYEEEADKIAELNENAPDLRENLCAIFGVEFNEKFSSLRLAEKKNILRELTDDGTILDNVAITALNQEDLAELLDAGTSTIYLCGEKFSIPLRVGNKKYIGVLDPPLIKIRATSQAELDDKNISFENVILPFENPPVAEEKVYQPIADSSRKTSMPVSSYRFKSSGGFGYGLHNINNYGLSFVDELHKKFKEIFRVKSTWWILDADGKLSGSDPTPEQKKMFIKRICGKGYSEKDLIHFRAMKDLSSGWAFTENAFCIDGDIKHCLNMNDYKNFKRALLYSDITSINFSDVLTVEFKVSPSKVDFFEIEFENTFHRDFFGAEIIRHIGQFLKFAKG